MTIQQGFSTAAQQTLTIRFSDIADLPTVLDFYKQNQHAHVDYRGDDIFTDRITSGRTIIVFKPDNTIGMSSMSHPFHAPGVTAQNGTWTEVGSTLGSMEGLGLYPFIIASQVVAEFLERTPEEDFFACIYKSNPAVTAMLNQKVGWNFITPSLDFALAVGEKPETMDNINWLKATSDTLSHQARIVLDQVNKGYVENKKTKERFKLDLTGFSLAHALRPQLEALATGRFGEMLEKSQAVPLGWARKALDGYTSGTRAFFPELVAKP